MKHLIIFDADSIIWTIAYKFRNKNLKTLVLMSLNKYIDDVIKTNKATHYVGFYGSKEPDRSPNYRYNIDPNYKGHRPDEPDWLVKWRPIIHNEMNKKWDFVAVDGMEADDACSITATQLQDDYDTITVATSDKDLLQIPDVICYNYVKHITEETTKLSGARALAIQMLTGDSADNIKGLFKIGPVKAKNILTGCDTHYSIWSTVIKAYIDKEQELREKAVRRISKEIKKDIEISDWAKNKTDKQIERKIKIDSKSLIDIDVDKYIPNGWKSYFKMQYSLLMLLTECPDNWELPDAVLYKTLETKSTVTDDSFLYL